ncbi:MAG: type 4a pilus biogenesis protein PilO [Armatimonadota bacterium]|nr:type 4a pilus biogenesis protein PilO [bacterium]MDW8321041.1 type 4a pilus biogenesis protein PilO [Armatimonadota bacterium]
MKLAVRDSSGAALRRGLLTLCIVVLLGGVAAIYWQYTGYSELQGRVLAAEKQVEEGKTIAQRLEHTQQQYQNVLQKLQHLELSVSERAYIPTLLKQLEASAKARRLRVLSVRPASAQPEPKAQQENDEQKGEEQKKPAEPYEKQVIDVSVRGQFWDVMRFTEDLTRFPKILAVERVQFRPNQRKEPTDPFEVETQFTLSAFIFRTKEGGAPQ